MEALRPEFPEEFAGHYVITLSGIPSSSQLAPGEDGERSQQGQLDHLKSVTFLKPDRGGSIQPGVVQQPISSSVNGSVLFGFSKIHLSHP